MIGNYLLTVKRHLLKHKNHVLLNILGFSIGISTSLLIFTYVFSEVGYDTYHPDHERVMRVALNRHFPDHQEDYATTPPTMAPTLAEELPEVLDYTRILDFTYDVRIKNGDQIYYEENVLAADSGFFDLFGIQLIEGSKDALRHPNSVIITQSLNKKYFGEESGYLKTLEINDTTKYTINGICEDVPKKTHFSYDMIISIRSFPISQRDFWGFYGMHNYIKIRENQDVDQLTKNINQVVESHLAPQVESFLGRPFEEYVEAGNIHNYFVQPVADIYLNSHFIGELKPNGEKSYLYLFALLGVLIIAIASFNYTNLSTALSIKRAKEIGVKKVMGSSKSQLRLQFLLESISVSLFAVLISLLIAIILLPFFNELTNKQIELSDFNWFAVIGFLLTLSIVTGVAAGIFPAYFMSSLQITKILKGEIKVSNSKFSLRNILVMIQFGASIFMVLATIFIIEQLDYMRDKDLGFEKDQMILLDVGNSLGARTNTVLNEFENIPGVSAVTASFHVPGRQSAAATFQAIGSPITERLLFDYMVTAYNFQETYDMKLIAGRLLNESFPEDSLSVIINERCAELAGWTADEAIGQEILITAIDGPHKIVGVLEDFHYSSLHEPIQPLAFLGVRSDDLNEVRPHTITVRVENGSSIQQTISSIESIWSDFVTEDQLRYEFLNGVFNNYYEKEANYASLFQIFSMVAIFISIFGIVSLSFFVAAERVKEIGVRKVLGASTPQIISLLSKQFLVLSVIANLVIWPVSYFLVMEWLGGYAYHITIKWLYFPLAGIAFTAIMIGSTSMVSYRAATQNPIDSISKE